MALRPTENWRAHNAVRRPERLLIPIDEALRTFEAELAALRDPSDEQIFGVVEQVVVALNVLDADHGADFDTMDREELCDYIDRSLTEADIDVVALAGRRGVDPAEITGEWRDW